MPVTPNGAIVFLTLCTLALFVPTSFVLPVFGAAPVIALAVALPPRSLCQALRQAALLTVPLFFFLVVVWVVIVKVAPSNILFMSGARTISALDYVSGVASRLFLFTLTITVLIHRFHQSGAVAFVQGLSCPPSAKALILTTLSLKNTIAQAAGRAHTALVAARVLTVRMSWQNITQGWRLVQGVWMATLSMAIERLDTKWQVEELPERFVLQATRIAAWQALDWVWCVLAMAAIMAAFMFG